jgi:hypothetical protein
MMSPAAPFLSAELAYRRDHIMVALSQERDATAGAATPRVPTRGRVVPRVVRRAIAGH